MHLKAWSTALLFCVVLPCLPAINLNINEFDNLLKTKKFLFVFFYATECKQCSKVEFTWGLLGKQANDFGKYDLVFGKVDCGIHRKLCSRENIKELPTIKLYTVINRITQIEDVYHGSEYNLESLESFLQDKVLSKQNEDELNFKISDFKNSPRPVTINGLTELTDENSAHFLRNGEHFVNFYAPWCEHCQNLKPIWESLARSLDSNDIVKISQVDCVKNEHTCRRLYKVKEFPSLFWISNGKVVERYKGLHKAENLKSFINSQLMDYELRQALLKYHESEDLDSFTYEKYDFKTLATPIKLDANNFKQTTASLAYTFVHFTVPWSRHCLQMKAEWDKLSVFIKDLNLGDSVTVKIATVDCSVEEKLCNKEQVEAYPTIYLYHQGSNLGEYEGERTMYAFMHYLNQHVGSGSKDEL